MRAEIWTDKNKPAKMMGCPMGPADFSAGDFQAFHPDDTDEEYPLLFGIDPLEQVELTVVNEFDHEVTQTFNPGVNPYLLKKIKQDATETIVVNYFI
jgi:hypothetical protein